MTTLNLALNEKLDVLFGGSWWYTATIIDIDDSRIKIHYDFDGDNHAEDEWADKKSDRFSKLHTHTIPITNISSPYSQQSLNVNVFYYQHDKKPYIIICANNKREIQQYDIQNAIWKKVCNYPEHIYPQKVCFDSKNGTLYFLDIKTLSIMCYKFDVYKNEWITDIHPYSATFAHRLDAILCKFCFIPMTKEKLHIFSAEGHFQIIEGLNELKMIEVEDNLKLMGPNVVCCYSMQQLITAKRGHLWYCDINESTDNYQWYEDDSKRGVNAHHLILAYQHILFIISQYFEDIYCVDLLHKKVYKADREIPASFSGNTVSVIKGDNDYIYIMDYGDVDIPNIRISLLDIIPKALYDYYRNNVCNPLVFGYISEMTKNKELMVPVPIDIVNLIFVFMPIFCEM